MITQNLKFPVIAITRDNYIHLAGKKEDLVICSKTAFKNGFYKRLKIYDSNNMEYILLKAKKIDTVGSFFGYNIFLNQKIKVELQLSDKPKKNDIDSFKQKVLYVLSKDKDFWNSDGRYQDRIDAITNASTPKYLIERFYNLCL